MNELSVSVVVPAYNAGRTIGRAVESVLEQRCRPGEILIVNDGGKDDLEGAVRKYGDAVKVLHKDNGGAGSARNFGIDRAKGNLIAFLDADDFWHADKLERQLEVFRKYPEVGVAAARYRVVAAGREAFEYPPLENGEWDRVVRAKGEKAFDLAMKLWTSTVVMRREALGEKRFETSLKTAEDRDLWVRLVVENGVYVDSGVLATLVAEPGSLSRADSNMDCANMLRIIEKYEGLLGREGKRRWEAKLFQRWAADHLGHGRPREAVRPAWKRLRREPFSMEAWWIMGKAMWGSRRTEC